MAGKLLTALILLPIPEIGLYRMEGTVRVETIGDCTLYLADCLDVMKDMGKCAHLADTGYCSCYGTRVSACSGCKKYRPKDVQPEPEQGDLLSG